MFFYIFFPKPRNCRETKAVRNMHPLSMPFHVEGLWGAGASLQSKTEFCKKHYNLKVMFNSSYSDEIPSFLTKMYHLKHQLD